MELAHTLAKLNNGIELNPPIIAPEDNWEPQLALGIQACIGTAWWLASLLLYVKNTDNDVDLTSMNGGTVFPIAWFWERIFEPNGLYNYFALGLTFNFLMYFLVSVLEFVSWMFYLANEDIYYAAYWFSTIGYWFSILGLPLPWIFMAVYINTQLDGYIDIFPGVWAVIVLISTLLMWVFFAGLHIYYVPLFLLQVAAMPKPPCVCSLPLVDAAPEDASEAKKEGTRMAIAERNYLCNLECPAVKGECPLSKDASQSDEEYAATCAALKD